jgi:hypothetical protein
LDTCKGWALRFPPTSQQFNITMKFPLEAEQNKTLSFLDVLVSRRPGGSQGYAIYKKSTHIDLYLHMRSEYHLSQKWAILNTFSQWVKTICDEASLGMEIGHIRRTFRCNGYSSHACTCLKTNASNRKRSQQA